MIGKDKDRISVSLNKELVEKIRSIAKAESRTLSQQLNHILIQYLQQKQRDSK